MIDYGRRFILDILSNLEISVSIRIRYIYIIQIDFFLNNKFIK